MYTIEKKNLAYLIIEINGRKIAETYEYEDAVKVTDALNAFEKTNSKFLNINSEFLNININSVQMESFNLRARVYEILTHESIDLKRVINHVGCSLEELQQFVIGDNPNFAGDKAMKLCDILDIDVNTIHPGYFACK